VSIATSHLAGTEGADRDNARVSELAVEAAPRRGRIWVILALAVAVAALGYAIVDLSTREADLSVVRVDGIADAQGLFGGVPQEGDRVGSADAPVSIQVFNDVQCSSCRGAFLAAIPTLVEDYVRPGDVKLLMRHYSAARNALELGFFGAEAAARHGYGWQYVYLFFRNQDEAERLGIDEELMASLAGSVGELEVTEWKQTLDDEGGAGGPIAEQLEGYEELGTELGIRARGAMIVSGPGGTRTLQDGPSLTRIEQAIAEVE